ncbi:hypothetical protein [Aurantivibrio plasticivorans]
MADNSSTLTSPLFFGGFNLIAVFLLFLLWNSNENESARDIILTGEWAPYSGEHLPQQGITTAIVTTVMENMDMQPEVRFLSWPRAQELAAAAENNQDPRGSFPYLRVPSREVHYYYSLPIMQVPQGIYFNALNTPTDTFNDLHLPWPHHEPVNLDELNQLLSPKASTAILEYQHTLLQQLEESLATIKLSAKREQDLLSSYHQQINGLILAYLAAARSKAQVIRIEGYEYPAVFNELMVDTSPAVEDTRAAFALLAQSDQPLLVIEAERVADTVLTKHFPRRAIEDQPDNIIKAVPVKFDLHNHFIAGKANPENRDFIKRFNKRLLELENEGRLKTIAEQINTAIDNSQLVELHPVKAGEPIFAYTANDPSSAYVLLTPGIKAKVLQWSNAYLAPQTKTDFQDELISVRIRQGPQTGKQFYIDGRSIRLP